MKGSLFGHLRLNRKCKETHCARVREGHFPEEHAREVRSALSRGGSAGYTWQVLLVVPGKSCWLYLPGPAGCTCQVLLVVPAMSYWLYLPGPTGCT